MKLILLKALYTKFELKHTSWTWLVFYIKKNYSKIFSQKKIIFPFNFLFTILSYMLYVSLQISCSLSLKQSTHFIQDACRRLLITLCCQGTNYTKCVYCKECTCRSACLRLRGDKIVLDIGGKMTWLLTGDFSLRKHLSMIAVPKLLHCYDCDARIDRGQTTCDCKKNEFR